MITKTEIEKTNIEEYFQAIQTDIARMVTREKFDRSISNLVTKEEFDRAISNLVSKEEFKQSLAKVATKIELNAVRADIKELREDVQQITEAMVTKADFGRILHEELEKFFTLARV